MDVLPVIRDALNGITPWQNAATEAVDNWLSSVVSLPDAHQSLMLVNANMLGNRKLGHTTFSVLDSTDLLNNSFIRDSMDIINQEAQIIQDPNIEGIVIHSASLKCNRKVDVAESQVIIGSAGNYEINSDNAVPHPREWTLEGYLGVASAVDGLFLIKPSLVIQTRTLDLYASSRRPVWFKDDHNLFYKVQITEFDYDHRPDSTNAVPVNIQLREYVPYRTSENDNYIIPMKQEA